MNDLMETHEGPEMDALRELRREVAGPDEAQRSAAWSRAHDALAEGVVPARRGRRAWAVGAVAAAAAAIAVGGVMVPRIGDGDPDLDMATSSSLPTPYATGPVWDATSSEEAEQVREYRARRVQRLDDGGVRVVLEGLESFEALTKALNAEGIPIRVWVVDDEPGTWDVGVAMPIDPTRGVDTSRAPEGAGYPRADVTEERVAGPGSPLRSLTFRTIPQAPVDITYAE